MEEQRTPRRRQIRRDNVAHPICPPVIRAQDLARMSEEQVERIHRNYYLSHGYRIEQIPSHPYSIFAAQQERARYEEEWQRRREEEEPEQRRREEEEWRRFEEERPVRRRREEEELRRIEEEQLERRRRQEEQRRRWVEEEPQRALQRREEEERQRFRISEEHLKKKNNGDATPSCSICLSPYRITEEAQRLRCTHVYHSKCINQWFQERKNCPLCRRQN